MMWYLKLKHRCLILPTHFMYKKHRRRKDGDFYLMRVNGLTSGIVYKYQEILGSYMQYRQLFPNIKTITL